MSTQFFALTLVGVSGHTDVEGELLEDFVGEHMNISYLQSRLVIFWFVREYIMNETTSRGQDKSEQDGQVLSRLRFPLIR